MARDRANTSELLAHLAEVDERRLYLPAAFPSMFAWCVGHLGLSEDSAAKRIQAARTARRFPVVFEMVADGRLTLSAVSLLAPRLTQENASDLLRVSARQSKQAIERLLAERFPQADLAAMLAPVASAPGAMAPAAADVQALSPEHAPGHRKFVHRSSSLSARTRACTNFHWPRGQLLHRLPMQRAPAWCHLHRDVSR